MFLKNQDMLLISCKRTLMLVLLWVQILPVYLEQDEDIPHNEVKNWALQFGVDLWEYGKLMTRMGDLQKKYHDAEVDVKRKDGLLLIREMAAEVQNLMDFKMSAVMRLMDSAEQAALTPRAESGQPFKYYNAKRLNAFGPDGQPAEGTREMVLTPKPHFDHLPVNTSLSSVLMPSGIDEHDPDVLNAIQWSERLDPIFTNNYEGDPSLSWQFFGSSTGFLRRYPAIAWPPEDMSTVWERSNNERAIYDFRSSAWYVNAATSPKDIVVLVDNSGSMSGHRANLARNTVEAILDTLSDNDFVNIYKFSATTEETTLCFKDQLVQANNENIRYLKESMGTLKPENIANFTSALITGFEVLQKYNRSLQGCQCNQAIMLITDGPPSTYKDIFKTYNFPHSPVRFFTYLIGKDSSGVNEMHWMACNHKGYYTRISQYETIKENVLKYIDVMARPMVMYQNDHPIQWTASYVGGRADSFLDNRRGQLMTTVSTPVFDRRNHPVRLAKILGVVGTDVSIDEIKKLVPPYKLGVNGYSFIVDNNGHVLYHPDLRPLNTNEQYEESLEPNYLSVDLTEVELVENESGPRENHTVLLDLRHDMIDQKEGETEISVKVHYDNMKRVTTRRIKYFHIPINGTQFSLGLAIPEGYGMYFLQAEQELKHLKKNVTDYFSGNNWKVHPDWVYCEYTSETSGEQWFKTAEERVLHFLSRTRRPGWKWRSLRSLSRSPREHHHVTTKQDKDAYYCDKTLLQSLVLDAMVTEGLEKRSTHIDKNQGYEIFGLVLTFVATRSGLLRWYNMTNLKFNEPHFSETNVRATDEVWYKRAVDQHTIEPESFVFSIPFDVGSYGQPMITATHAVFVEHKGHRAPAAVVGLQFQHSTLATHFHNITSKCIDSSCKKTCANDTLDCYVLDNNGFIIISENKEHTGRFFGQIDGTIMDSLVQDRIYVKVPVYDYQGACSKSKSYFNGGANKFHVLDPAKLFISFVMKYIIFLITKIETVYGTALAFIQEADDSFDVGYDDYGTDYHGTQDEQDKLSPTPFFPPYESDPVEEVNTKYFGVRRCDRKVDLYILQPEKLNTNPLKGKLTNCHNSGCERPFSVQKIPHSNLILLVVDTICPCGSKQFSINPEEVNYDPKNGGCLYKPRETLYRRRPPKCINYHPEEIEIRICGNAPTVVLNLFTFLGTFYCLFASLS